MLIKPVTIPLGCSGNTAEVDTPEAQGGSAKHDPREARDFVTPLIRGLGQQGTTWSAGYIRADAQAASSAISPLPRDRHQPAFPSGAYAQDL